MVFEAGRKRADDVKRGVRGVENIHKREYSVGSRVRMGHILIFANWKLHDANSNNR